MLMNFLHIYRQQFISLIDYHKLKTAAKLSAIHNTETG